MQHRSYCDKAVMSSKSITLGKRFRGSAFGRGLFTPNDAARHKRAKTSL